MRYIELLNRIEQGRKSGLPDDIFLAEMLAHQGRYQVRTLGRGMHLVVAGSRVRAPEVTARTHGRVTRSLFLTHQYSRFCFLVILPKCIGYD